MRRIDHRLAAAAPVPAAALALLALLAVLAVGGCGEDFTGEEMRLGDANKPRPLAVLCEPAEAAPGDTVAVTLVFHQEDAAHTDVSWRVALDYDPGMYGADVVERRVVDLDAAVAIPDFTSDGEGFRTQTFAWTVPDSALLWASCLPERLDDGIIDLLAAQVLPDVPPGGIAKSDVDAFLRALTPADLAGLAPDARAAILDLADLFACRVRLRATLESDIRVDVTRCLTVRYSRRLGSPNVNANPVVTAFEVVGVPQPDFDWSDIETVRDELVHYPFAAADGGVPEVRIPRRTGWTFYLTLQAAPQTYTSPFSRDRLFTEDVDPRWYDVRLDAPGAGPDLFVTDEGDAAEMYQLDESVRLQPPATAAEARYRVALCVRDERIEWDMYQGSPGATLLMGDVVFVAP